MLVEDDNNLREIYGARLMAEGYEIVSAADGEEALALAVKEKPDLIISDVMMPKISGFDMLDILRTTPETKSTKVIMMTALSQPEDRQRGESLGADRYLVKSQVTLEDVVVAVHEILGDGAGQTMSQDQASAQAPTDPAPADPAPAAPATDSTSVAAEAPAQDDSPPKALGANDAPEPASQKRKIIQPINDLAQDDQRLKNLVAAEEASEHQAEIINAQLKASSEHTSQTNRPPDELASPPAQTTSELSLPPVTASPNATLDAQVAPANDDLASEKAELEEEIAQLANSGVIEQEATQAPVEIPDSQPTEEPQLDTKNTAVQQPEPSPSEVPITPAPESEQITTPPPPNLSPETPKMGDSTVSNQVSNDQAEASNQVDDNSASAQTPSQPTNFDPHDIAI
jgi:DNA-binding response OmpR family regulator